MKYISLASQQETAVALPFIIKELTESRRSPVLNIHGKSGKRYVFKWNDRARGYTYAPANEVEALDVFGSQGRMTSSVFGAIAVPVSAASPVTPDANRNVATAEQIESCILRGIVISEDDSAELVDRLIGAFDRGAALAKTVSDAERAKAEASAETERNRAEVQASKSTKGGSRSSKRAEAQASEAAVAPDIAEGGSGEAASEQ